MRRIELFCDDLEPLYVPGDFAIQSISAMHAQARARGVGEVTPAAAVAKLEVNIAEHGSLANPLGWYKAGGGRAAHYVREIILSTALLPCSWCCLSCCCIALEEAGWLQSSKEYFFSPLCSSVSLLAVRLALLTHSYHQQRCFGVGLAVHRLLALQLCRQMCPPCKGGSTKQQNLHFSHHARSGSRCPHCPRVQVHCSLITCC